MSASGIAALNLSQVPVVHVPNGRPALKPDLGPDGLPPLPEVKSEQIRLQVYTHRSYYARPTHLFEDLPDDPSPDNEMLEHLGDAVLSLVVTGLIREIYPYLRVGSSTKIRALVVGNPTLASISVMYRLPDNLRMHPAQAITLRASTNIQADLFEAFVGGLYLDRGLDVIKSWLCPLFRPYLVEAYRHVRMQYGLSPDPDPAPPPITIGSSLSSSSALRPPPSHMPASIGHLSLFNQHLQQQNMCIEWVWAGSEGQGSRTTPIWVVQAMVGDECFGQGRGSTKKAAKNEAAKEGLQKMGIYVSPPDIQNLAPASSL
ncbi:uncharacterized protein FIBRA_00245 [Fibroporia radiculosa]|uniref:RNase III domain-containing protein n=1 Tax=Fibroporia radiculosa TaxID=599839 RepID=J7SBZ0_9APHY|nr:uncharacterized protein FIBRA_00245 [Fibroporia radiculosa]CCL98251.1 predicted protein [Fibroporia radiculosa]